MNDVYDQAIAELEQALAELAALRQQLAALRDDMCRSTANRQVLLAWAHRLDALLTPDQGTESPAPRGAVHDSGNQARTPTRVKE